tara:strand:- start:232 stop:378 length:147 start_codon:yes stop_codon:yes gene_type:complete
MSHSANDWVNELRHEELLEEQEAELQAEFFHAEMKPMYDECEELELKK